MQKIIIIEDDKTISEELKELLDNAGYEGIILNDFPNIKQKILKLKADLILLDINLPIINGELLLKR